MVDCTEPMKPLIEEFLTDFRIQEEEHIMRAVADVGIIVDKQRLIKALEDSKYFYEEGYKAAAPKHGYWIEYELDETYGSEDSKVWYKCSECLRGAHGWVDGDTWYSYPILSDYCPNCGAYMKKEEE